MYCGDTNPHHLTIDHIRNDGNILRKQDSTQSKIYNWLKKNGYPEGYQILCWNHNEEKKIYGVMSI